MPLPPNPCDHCGDPVQVRRPSKSGKSFCPKSKCQTAKQRFYREGNGSLGKLEKVKTATARFVADLVNKERTNCGRCSLPNALPGWIHRSNDPLTPCYGVGSEGSGVPGAVMDAVWPERAPK